MSVRDDPHGAVAAALAGDDTAFPSLVEPHRRELHVAEITAFEPHLFAAFGLPLVLHDPDR